MFRLRKHHELVPAIALMAACTFSSACTVWHTTPLQPQRFSANTSPGRARLTFNDGTQFTASHPVLVGDSLVWAGRWGATPRDTARGAVLTSSIQRAEVSRVDAVRTIGLLAVLGGLVFAGIWVAAGLANAGPGS